MEIKAAVCRRAHAPLTIESIEIDMPSEREVLVRTAATGVYTARAGCCSTRWSRARC